MKADKNVVDSAAYTVLGKVGMLSVWWKAVAEADSYVECASILHFAAYECFQRDGLKRSEYTRAGYALLACVNVLADNYPEVWAPIARLRAEKV